METAPRCAFVIFGMTGDLAARKLVPALFSLHRDGALHEETVIVGYARSDTTSEAIRDGLRSALEEEGTFDDKAWASLAPRIHYVQGGYDDIDDLEDLGRRLDELGLPNRVFYTATPPQTYAGIAAALGKAGLSQHDSGRHDRDSDGFIRLVIEKPFGNDLASAQELNRTVLEWFREEQVFRIDHYLAKETAQNLAALRFANTLFEPMWTNKYIDHVQITMAEPMGVEGRGSFYEATGVLRDVMQNHLLQLIALVAMEPPARYEADAVRDEKVKVFRAMACPRPEDAVLGQYVAGNGMPGYRDEDGVADDSHQATYAAVEFAIRNWRWSGVPFYVRSGKRLETKATEIVLQFRTPPHIPFTLDEPLKADRLILRVSPEEGIDLRFNAKTPGQSVSLDRVSLSFSYGDYFGRPNPDAYETLVLDVMHGDATLFMRADEVEAQWRVIEPLLDHLDREPVFYEAGSMGPKQAYDLLENAHRTWSKPTNLSSR